MTQGAADASLAYDVIVSSENSLYLAWQTQLFCFSALTTLGIHPVVIVHGADEPLREEFVALQEWGCRVIRAPSFAMTPSGFHYPPRNELGSLLTAASVFDASSAVDHVLFCEPDMLFVRPLTYRSSPAGEFYNYLRYEEPRVVRAAGSCGVGHLVHTLNATRRFGVPYLLPVRMLHRLARRWLEVLDRFDELHWIDIMYAFGIATLVEGLDVDITHVACDNLNPMRPVRGLIHCCHKTAIWNKRDFTTYSPFELPDEALPAGVPGTVIGEIMRQVKQARAHFREASASRS